MLSLTAEALDGCGKALLEEEHSAGTVEKYLRELKNVMHWLGGQALSRKMSAAWKEHLIARGYRSITIRSMLWAVNGFFHL